VGAWISGPGAAVAGAGAVVITQLTHHDFTHLGEG